MAELISTSRTYCIHCLRAAFVSFALAASAAGCSWIPFMGGEEESAEPEIETSEQKLYRDAQRKLRSGNYQQAIGSLEMLESRFPFGRYAEQAQLELIYARYMSYDLEGASAAADRFIRLHPQHSNIDYAWYIKGLASFSKNDGLMDRLFETEAFKRDMEPARQSYADFAQLLARYPDSKYVPDAEQRMVHLRNLMASADLAVADYYLRRGAHVAAANRARYVLENYPQSSESAEALVVLVESNYKLGLTDEANNALRVLSLNYPNHPAFDGQGNLVLTDRIRNRDRSWTNIMTLGLLDRPEVPPPITLKHPEGFVPPRVEQQPDAKQQKKRKGWFSWLPFVG